MGIWLTQQYKIITSNLGDQADVVSGSAYMHMFSSTQPVCLFVGAFNPFTFKIIIDCVWSCYHIPTCFEFIFCRLVFSFACFLPRNLPLAFVVKLVWWCWILLTFAYLESFWFLHEIWRRILLGGVFLVVGSSFSSL